MYAAIFTDIGPSPTHTITLFHLEHI